MSSTVGIEIGAGVSTDSTELTGSRTCVLRLTGQQVNPRLHGVFAIVDAPPDELQWIGAALETAFTVAIIPGTEEDYVSRVLARFDRHGVSIVLAVWLDHDLVVGSHHAGRAQLCNLDGCVDVAIESQWGAGGVRVARLTPSAGSSLVLLSPDVAQYVRQSELRELVGAGFSSDYSAENAAKWLATLATARGAHDARALVLHITGRRATQVTAGQTRSRFVPGQVALGHGLLIGIAAVLSVLVPVAALALAWHVITSNGSSKSPVAARITTPTPSLATPTPLPVIQHRTVPTPTLPPATATSVLTARPIARATLRSTRSSTPSLESWKFPALPHASGTILLALYNPQTVAVVTDVRIPGMSSRRVRIPPKSSVRLQLPAQHGVPALIVQVTPPVVPARLVVG
jgi:hypothetical protein